MNQSSSENPPNLNHERIFLTGYMGAGKSTIGRLLANHLGYEFADTDLLLKRQFKKTISKIFQEDGEAAFRAAEVELLSRLSEESRIVISTGGGTLTREETFGIAQANGIVIYLCAPPQELFERVIFSPKDRPMLDIPNAEEEFIKRFAQREQFYKRAHLSVNTQHKNPGKAVQDILQLLQPPEAPQ